MTQNPERLDAILGSLTVGIIALLPDGVIELLNAEASRILGISSGSSVGRTLTEALGPEHPVVALAAEKLGSEREVSSHACEIRPRLGSSSLVVDLAAAAIGIGETTEGMVLTLRDRTIGHELEALIDQRLRSELFAHLAAGIAHELGNPLGGIRGAAVLDNLVELHSQSESWKEIEVLREYDPSIPELDIDADRMAQVFLNLMRNAVQAMAGKGRLTLRTRVETNYQASPGARAVHMMRLDVEDTGPGIPEEQLPHIFTPFFTQRSQGTGLGLAIAQHWTVRHDGHIQVSSEPGQGARVRVLLPLRSQP
jgi:two-component system nitrogen regulation sensor histidine kinase GlnL